MNVRLQQLNPTIGDIEGNTNAILRGMQKAGESNIELLILPELVVCGYPPMDLLERGDFREAIYQANSRIIEASEKTAVLFGTVTPNKKAFGRKCYNSAILAGGGRQLAEVHKTLLPTYDVFDDSRYFEPNEQIQCVDYKGVRLGITICEDIWYNQNDIQYHLYEVDPAKELARQGADVIINISASPFTKTKPQSRQEMLQNHVRKLQLPVFYANQVGGNTDLVFDGDSMAIDVTETVIARAPLFEQAYIDIDWNHTAKKLSKTDGALSNVPSKQEGIFKAIKLGLNDYLKKTGVTDKVALGLSGGIDSALVACLAVETLGADNVVGITMPSEFSSEGSLADSEKLAQKLGIKLHRLAIKTLYDEYLSVLKPLFEDMPFDLAEENLQSRIRGVLLMAFSNKFGHMVLNPGNKSELATGYCTLYGDMAGGLGLIADLYKTEVYELARWLNDVYYNAEIIPEEILTKPPSAELRPGQQDTDSLPEYAVLDEVLRLYIEAQESAGQIIERGFEKETVQKIIRLVDRATYKRLQAAPGIKLSTKAFGIGRRWPVVQRWPGSGSST